METLTIAALKEVPKLVSALVGLGLVWFVGQRLTVFWNLRQKQRENDLATARDFHSLYGEFFAIWKLWDYYVEYRKSKSLPEVSQWSLLERACVAEGKLESTLVRLVSERDLTASEIALLAQFRQLYQILRESIEQDRPVGWRYSDHPCYIAFKKRAPEIAALIVKRSGVLPDALVQITSNRWEIWRHDQENPHATS